ncbi:MAG: RDD family protein [Acidimicrobiia bacterium]|nr:RDD family protein [Acidimicrobiia bacterium]
MHLPRQLGLEQRPARRCCWPPPAPGSVLGSWTLRSWSCWLALLFPTILIFEALGFWDYGSWSGLRFYWLAITPVFLMGLLYEVTMISAGGRTLGKMATGIHVIRKDNGDRPGPIRSIRRWFIPGLLLLIPFVGWLATLICRLSLTWGKDRQGWHDMTGGTLVVVKQSR